MRAWSSGIENELKSKLININLPVLKTILMFILSERTPQARYITISSRSDTVHWIFSLSGLTAITSLTLKQIPG